MGQQMGHQMGQYALILSAAQPKTLRKETNSYHQATDL